MGQNRRPRVYKEKRNFWRVVDILKVGGFFATAILRFFTFFRFSGFPQFFFLGIFLTKFKAGIAKNQNFGDNSFFSNEIFIVT